MKENDIIKDSYYLVNLFMVDNIKCNYIKLQNLMFLFEAFYMALEDKPLYENNFCTLAYGASEKNLYKEYIDFRNNNILLSLSQIKAGQKIEPYKKEIMIELYLTFKNLSSNELSNLVREENSPWHKTFIRNGETIGFEEKYYIDKKEAKDWFKRNFMEEETKSKKIEEEI